MALVVLLSACGRRAAGGPYHDQHEQTRDPARAEMLFLKAQKRLAAGDDERAQDLLRQALDADLYHGRAHNNLGVLLLRQDRLYDAAVEFTWARRLLPGHPDPRVNLALALWRGGKIDQALAACEAALEAQSDYLPAVQTAAVIRIESRRHDAETIALLAEVRERSADPAWRHWAERHQLRLVP